MKKNICVVVALLFFLPGNILAHENVAAPESTVTQRTFFLRLALF